MHRVALVLVLAACGARPPITARPYRQACASTPATGERIVPRGTCPAVPPGAVIAVVRVGNPAPDTYVWVERWEQRGDLLVAYTVEHQGCPGGDERPVPAFGEQMFAVTAPGATRLQVVGPRVVPLAEPCDTMPP